MDNVCVLGLATQSTVGGEASAMKIIDAKRVLDEDHRLHALFSLSPKRNGSPLPFFSPLARWLEKVYDNVLRIE
jgi:hypothetical protein